MARLGSVRTKASSSALSKPKYDSDWSLPFRIWRMSCKAATSYSRNKPPPQWYSRNSVTPGLTCARPGKPVKFSATESTWPDAAKAKMALTRLNPTAVGYCTLWDPRYDFNADQNRVFAAEIAFLSPIQTIIRGEEHAIWSNEKQSLKKLCTSLLRVSVPAASTALACRTPNENLSAKGNSVARTGSGVRRRAAMEWSPPHRTRTSHFEHSTSV